MTTITRPTGPTPVGQRLRAQTIPSRRFDGPTVDEWDWDDDPEPAAAGRGDIAWLLDSEQSEAYWLALAEGAEF